MTERNFNNRCALIKQELVQSKERDAIETMSYLSERAPHKGLGFIALVDDPGVYQWQV